MLTEGIYITWCWGQWDDIIFSLFVKFWLCVLHFKNKTWTFIFSKAFSVDERAREYHMKQQVNNIDQIPKLWIYLSYRLFCSGLKEQQLHCCCSVTPVWDSANSIDCTRQAPSVPWNFSRVKNTGRSLSQGIFLTVSIPGPYIVGRFLPLEPPGCYTSNLSY